MSNEHVHALTCEIARPVRRPATLRVVVLDRWARIGHTIWEVLVECGHQRSARHLLELADRWEHEQPKLARELRSYARGGSSY